MDLSGWKERERTATSIYHQHVDGGALSLTVMDIEPDVPRRFERGAWLGYARTFAAPGALVSLDAHIIQSLPAMEFIYKYREGSGFGYTGVLFIEWEERHCGIVSSWKEGSPTGVREASLSVKLLDEGKIRIPKRTFLQRLFKTPLQIEGFFADPYDASYRGEILRSICDNAEYDDQFPMHPLSRVRSCLRTTRETIRFARTGAVDRSS